MGWKEALPSLARECGLDRVVLFGSRARGDNRERSDIDLAVSGGDRVRFALRAEEELPTLLSLDIVDLDGPVQAERLESIRREGVVLYEKV